MTQDELLVKSAGVFVKTTLVDFPGLVASTYFLKGCNLRCPYCYNAELVDQTNQEQSENNPDTKKETAFISPVQVLEHLNARKKVIQGLVISGGEALINPVTPLLIKKVKELGLKVKIDTNGTVPLILETLIKNPETNPDFIAMDIKTSPSKYKTRIPAIKSFINADYVELIKSSISLLKTRSPETYEFRSVLVPGLISKDDITEIASLLPQNASWQFAQFRNENCLDSSYNDKTPYIDRELNELVSYAKTLIPGAVLR